MKVTDKNGLCYAVYHAPSHSVSRRKISLCCLLRQGKPRVVVSNSVWKMMGLRLVLKRHHLPPSIENLLLS